MPKFRKIIKDIQKDRFVRLGDIAQFSKETSDYSEYESGEFKYLEISGVSLGLNKYRTTTVSVSNAPSRAKMKTQDGDIVIALTRPHRGAIAQIKESGVISSTGFSVIRKVVTQIDREWLLFVLLSNLSLQQMLQRSSGGNYPAIIEDEVKRIYIPIVDYSKQLQMAANMRTKAKEFDAQIQTSNSFLNNTLFILERVGLTFDKDNNNLALLNASQNNALTFFVGAGVSALSGAPTWKALIHAISDKLGRTRKDEYSSDENLQIPQMFYYSLGENKEEYYRFVKEQLYSASLLPNTIHREMLNLNPVSFITTNYDTLLEDAAVQYCQSFKVVSQDEDVPTIFGDRFILKLHGDFKHNNFVLKEEDYLNYSENFKLIETLVKSIFSTNTVVFIGYSLNDYNIKLILNWTKTLLKGSFREPIFLYVGSSALTDTELIYQQSKGLTVVEWNKLITSTDDYLDRYNAIFAALKNQSKLSLEGKSEDEAFEILYNLLQPLDRLNALRIEDVSKRLYPYIRIRDDGVIGLSQRDDLLLKRFFAINLKRN